MPISAKRTLNKVQSFLIANDLSPETLDCYVGLFDGERLVGGGGTYKNVIKCVAIDQELREQSLTNKLVSCLRQKIKLQGYGNIFVFTKPMYKQVFTSLAFYVVGSSSQAILLESNHYGIDDYAQSLRPYSKNGVSGAVVVNCNPFTNGHLYLIEQASKLVDFLHVFVVSEDLSKFRFDDRLRLVRQGISHLPNVIVHQGSEYIISAATFPSYFLKDNLIVARNQMQLDLDIFCKHIAPALNITKRFVGSEREIFLCSYNEIMQEVLAKHNIECKVIERLKLNDKPISASYVRELFAKNDFETIKQLVPQSTYDFLVSHDADYAR
ncbi:MAG: [citrate (pro-3S)-lyase] ligase [Clostridia bacterium]